jgi:hypothetical protein
MAQRAVTFQVMVPVAANAATAARQRRAIQRAATAVRELFARSTPEELERFAERIGTALEPAPPVAVSPERDAFLAEVRAQEQPMSAEAFASLVAENLARARRLRDDLLAGSLTAPQVARLLGVSRQTPHDRVRRRAMLAVPDRGVLRFPAWQFDPGRPDGVIAGLPAVLAALDLDPLAQVSWLIQPRSALDGRSPLDLLKEGQVAPVVRLARAVGSG